jgi:DNA-binding CsgD family transcriptional regulator
VARLTIRGATHAEIAEELGVSVHTVVSHVRSAYRRTGASSRETLLAALLPRPDRDQATGSAVPA